jgi:predicted RNase H-like nuclease (RuvC/YqgF family)
LTTINKYGIEPNCDARRGEKMGQVQEMNNKIIAELRQEIEELIKCNKDLAKANDRHKETIERYEKALEEINQTAVYYGNKGWALNPDRIGKIVVKALDD